MPSELKWSNRARTGLSVNQGDFKHGNAHWIGYEDLAMHIAQNPKHFTPTDRRKARNILLNIGAANLASQLNPEGE